MVLWVVKLSLAMMILVAAAAAMVAAVRGRVTRMTHLMAVGCLTMTSSWLLRSTTNCWRKQGEAASHVCTTCNVSQVWSHFSPAHLAVLAV